MKNSLILAGAVLAFASAGSAQNTIFTEDFSANVVPPTGWTELNNGNDLGWEPDYYGAATHDDYYGWNDNHLMTPALDLTGYAGVVAEIDQNQVYATWRYANTIEISLDGGLTFTVVYDETSQTSGQTTIDLDLGAYDGVANVGMSFHYIGDYANEWDLLQVDVLDGGGSVWPPPGSIFGEDFNAGTPPANWSEINNGISAGWEDSGGRAWHDDYYGWNENVLVSPAIDMSASSDLTLHWADTQVYATWRYTNTVEATQDGGLTWAILYDETGTTSGTFDIAVDLSAYAYSTNTQIGFNYVGDYANEWIIDNLYVMDNGGGGGGPIYTVTNLVAGQLCDLVVSGCDATSSVLMAYSLNGSGPTNTPYGAVDMSMPIRRFPPLACDSTGTAARSANIPANAAGIMVYTQCAELLAAGGANLTNSHAIAIQ